MEMTEEDIRDFFEHPAPGAAAKHTVAVVQHAAMLFSIRIVYVEKERFDPRDLTVDDMDEFITDEFEKVMNAVDPKGIIEEEGRDALRVMFSEYMLMGFVEYGIKPML